MNTPIRKKIDIDYFKYNIDILKTIYDFYIAGVGDLHCESAYFDSELFNQQMSELCEDKAYIFITGDTVDSIASIDKRFDETNRHKDFMKYFSSTRGIKTKQDYFNALIDYTVDLILPYAHRIYAWVKGNHNPQRYGLDIDELIVEKLNVKLKEKKIKHQIDYATSNCFVKLIFKRKNNVVSLIGYLEHGNSNAPITKGIIESYRKSAVYDADFVMSGHTHTKYKVVQTQVINTEHNIYTRDCMLMRTGSFLSYGGYAKNKNLTPMSTGCTIQKVNVNFNVAEHRERYKNKSFINWVD